jgi:glucan phosphoethanolaminetransferase (alkaline phosphatase superfamily)
MKGIRSMLWFRRFCACALWALYAAPAMTVAVWAWRARAPRSAVAAVIAFVLLALLFAFITRTWRRFFFVQYPICLVGVAFALYTIAFGMPPGQTLAGILAATSPEELWGFVGMPQGRVLVMLLAAWSLCYLASAWVAPAGRIFEGGGDRLARIAVVLLVPAAAFAATNPSQLIDGMALEPLVGSAIFFGDDIPMVKAEMRGSAIHKIPYGAHRSGPEEVHVLIVGESMRRDSLSVYGYGRQTTPFLDSLKNEAIFLQDMTADANLTSWAVPIMLTGMSPDAYDIGKVRGNIFDLAREGGYRTVFLANQDINIAAIVGVDADLVESPIDLSRNINGRLTHDGEMLPAFRREVARSGKSRFIGIHMMGSHWEYYNRYPQDFQHFGSSKKIGALSMLSIFLAGSDNDATVADAYDNSLLYTDSVLRQIIERARQLSVPATVTFVPDHGEDIQLLDGGSGHGGPTYTSHSFAIPAFVWANDAYRKAHPDIIAALKMNAAKPIRTHNVFYTVADLMGIQFPAAAATQSFASEKFVPDQVMKYIAGGVLVDGLKDPAAAAESKKTLALAR